MIATTASLDKRNRAGIGQVNAWKEVCFGTMCAAVVGFNIWSSMLGLSLIRGSGTVSRVLKPKLLFCQFD